jgi:hypothetical protein
MRTRISVGTLAMVLCLVLGLGIAGATNSLQMASRVGEPGQPNLPMPVNGVWDDALAAYTISIEFDPTFFEVTDVNLTGTVATAAEYFVPQWSNETGYVTAEVVMGKIYPGDIANSIPAGSGCLLNVMVDIKSSAPFADSTFVELTDGLGIPPRQNRFYWNDATATAPALEDGRFRTIYVWACDFDSLDGGFGYDGEWQHGDDPWDSTNGLWGTDLEGPYDPDACDGLQASFGVPVGYESAYMTFSHKYSIEEGKGYPHDGGNIQALVPPLMPETWAVVYPEWDPYDAEYLYNECLDHLAGYTGTSMGWPTAKTQVGVDLSDYVSPRVGLMTIYYDIMWVFGSDEWESVDDGWFIDDVRFAAAPGECGLFFIRGDVNNDGTVNIGDVTYLNNYLYSSGPPPDAPCDRADANDDGAVNIGDMTYLITFIYQQGPVPPWPYPLPGIDSTPDDIPVECGAKSAPLERREVLGTGPASLPFGLDQNFPNPFRETTEIRYDLPGACHVTLEVYNSLGQKVATILDRDQEAGHKMVEWEASGYPSGIYFYRLKAGELLETRKMIVLK